jgi:hypothetical protein
MRVLVSGSSGSVRTRANGAGPSNVPKDPSNAQAESLRIKGFSRKYVSKFVTMALDLTEPSD